VDDAPIPALQDAIRHLHGCESTFVEAVEVRETFQGETVWEGAVKVFDLVGHPTASRAYAWSHPTTGEKRRFVAVLGLGPVDSPLAAVRAAVMAEMRGRRN
jgi:hypothetical protein